MAERFFWREIGMLSAPLLVIGGVFGWGAWQKRYRTPRIALSVRFDQVQKPAALGFGFSPDEKLRFNWVANIKGGPKSGYRFSWNERIVAKTGRGAVMVWQLKAPSKGWQLNAVGGFHGTNAVSMELSSWQGLNHATHFRRYKMDETALPLDTQSLEWSGEMVAIPSDDGDIWQSPLPHETLENWANIAGAATWKRTVPLRYDAQNPGMVLIRSQKSKEPTPGSKHEVVEVEILSRRGNRRAFHRVVAFDGTTKRTLWTDTDRLNGICQSIGHGGYAVRDGESFSFELGSVPASWGEVVFLCDTVFDTSNRAPTVTVDKNTLSERALAAFQQQTGGLRVKRRLVLRPKAKP